MIVGSYGKSMFNLVRNWQTIFKSGWIPSCIPTSNGRELLLLHIFTSIWYYQCFRFLPYVCVVEGHCFSLHFPNDILYETSFCILISICVFCFGELSVKVFGLSIGFLFSYFWVLKVLCVFWIIVLYHMCLLQLFSSPFVVYFPILLVLSFIEKF